MLRSACLLILLGLGFQPSTAAQDGLAKQPGRFQISDSSPLSKLSGNSTSVTPAAFLKTNQATTPSRSISDQQDKIPAVSTDNRKSTSRSLSSDSKSGNEIEIDPLNIPSSPIPPRGTSGVSGSGGFQPRPSGFQPPGSSGSSTGSANSAARQPTNFRLPQLQSPQPSTSANQTTGSPASPSTSGFVPGQAPAGSTNPIQPAVPAGSNFKPATGNPAELPRLPADRTAPRIQPSANAFSTPDNPSPPQSSILRGQRSDDPAPMRRSDDEVTGVSDPQDNPRVAERAPLGSPTPINGIRNRLPAAAVSTDDTRLFSTQQLSPQLKLLSSGPSSISVNKAGEFEVKILNVGQIDANEVMVGIEIPAWVEVVSRPVPSGGEAEIQELGDGKGIIWSLNSLPSGREAIIAIQLEPKENRPFRLKTEWTTAPASTEAEIMVTQAKLATRISGPVEVQYGEKAVYTITIENTGNGDAEQVSVALSESLGGDRAAVGSIEAGATRNFEVELTAGKAGPLKLEALVTGDAGLNSAIAKEIVVRRAKLVVQATGPEFKYAGSALTYNIAVENRGDAPARNIEAAALLPLNAKYISGLNQITESEGRKIAWKIPEIPAGSSREFIVTCLINQAGEARMEIGVRAEDGLTSGGIVNTKIEALADLELDVVDPRGPQAVGRQVTYELHIKNQGTKAARDVKVAGEFSDFIDPVAGTGAKATIEKGGVILFDPIPEIKVGETVVIKVMAEASQAGTHTFRAIVECQEQDIRKVSEGTTKFFGESKVTPPPTDR